MLGLLQQVDGRLGDALGILATDGPATVRHLEAAAATIARARQSLNDAAATGPVDPAARETLARLRQTYTMEAERRIHDLLLGAEALAA